MHGYIIIHLTTRIRRARALRSDTNNRTRYVLNSKCTGQKFFELNVEQCSINYTDLLPIEKIFVVFFFFLKIRCPFFLIFFLLRNDLGKKSYTSANVVSYFYRRPHDVHLERLAFHDYRCAMLKIRFLL